MGKHNKPTQSHTSRNVIAGAMGLAAATTGPLMIAGAPTANASVPSVNWDNVAACESSGDWSINTGNGFSGGLQFTDSTWKAYGGTTAHAYQASVSEQIAVADRTLAGQGIGAWPVCGPKGLGGSTPLSTPAQTPSAPVQTPNVQATGRRDPVTGLGSYVCGPSYTEFKACHPAQFGQVEQFPYYDGRGPTATVRPAAQVTNTPGNNYRDLIPSVIQSNQSSPPVVKAAAATVAPMPSRTTAFLNYAKTYIGVPYLFGGNTRAGLDCSGLVQQVLLRMGIQAPRVAQSQYAWTTHITQAQARPGDLVFGGSSPSNIQHVGIYLGNNMMVDAADVGIPVAIHHLYPDSKYFGRVPGL